MNAYRRNRLHEEDGRKRRGRTEHSTAKIDTDHVATRENPEADLRTAVWLIGATKRYDTDRILTQQSLLETADAVVYGPSR